MTDWADEAAHYLVGDVPWTFSARWAEEMPNDVAFALRDAAKGPRPSGTDKSAWIKISQSLVKRLVGFMERKEIEVLRNMIVGALATASTRNSQPISDSDL